MGANRRAEAEAVRASVEGNAGRGERLLLVVDVVEALVLAEAYEWLAEEDGEALLLLPVEDVVVAPAAVPEKTR